MTHFFCLAETSSYTGEGCREPQGAKSSAGKGAQCHPKVPLVNGPWDVGEPWLLWARQSANTSSSLSLQCMRSRNKGSTFSYSLAQEHLMDSHWSTTHSSALCLSATQTYTAPKFQKVHFSIDLGKNFSLKAAFQEKKWIFIPNTCFPTFTHHRNSDDC